MKIDKLIEIFTELKEQYPNQTESNILKLMELWLIARGIARRDR